MDSIAIKSLEQKGFKISGKSGNASYYSKNSDHRIVFSDGKVIRGYPSHRKIKGK